MLQQMRSAAKYIWLFIIIAFVGGFLLVDTSGLIGSAAITPTTAVAEVNGRDILYTDWQQRVSQVIQNQQQTGRSLSQDEIRQVENDVLDEMIMQVLLEDEFRKRGITVTDDELREFARYAPPPFLYNAPELQTDGQFDPVKYQRLLASPQARQGGILLALESYYRSEVPRQKLFEQITDGIYLTDAELWRTYQDDHDTAQVSFAMWPVVVDSADMAAVPAADVQSYFASHRDELERPGQAWVSLIHIPRRVTAADSAATRDRLLALRSEIMSGQSTFEDVARRESHDSASGVDGGNLGRGTRGRFVAEFEEAVYRLRPGVISEPVLSPFGYHLIRVDERKGDTVALRHILLRPMQSDSAALATDRMADDLATLAAGATNPAQFDTAALRLRLPVSRIQVVEDQTAMVAGRVVPGVSAWAFGGTQQGESSDLFDAEDGFWLARLDSLIPGGEARLERVDAEIRERLARDRKIQEEILPAVQVVAQGAASTGLEAAARAANRPVEKTSPFTRTMFVPALAQYSRAKGAAFGLPVGAVSEPIVDQDAVFLMRVDRRVNATREAFEAQLGAMRQTRMQQLQQQRIAVFLNDLREAAAIQDHRDRINRALRQIET